MLSQRDEAFAAARARQLVTLDTPDGELPLIEAVLAESRSIRSRRNDVSAMAVAGQWLAGKIEHSRFPSDRVRISRPSPPIRMRCD